MPITVLLACFNGAAWLDECVESVLAQSWTDFEFLVIDDGSTDDSGDILDRYASRDARMRIIHKSNTGLADSLNVGLAAARGEWIARLDADDVAFPTRLERQLAFVRKHEAVSFVGGGLIEIDSDGVEIAAFRYPKTHGALTSSLERMGRFPAHSTAFYRRSLVLGLGGYRARIARAEDYDLWLRLSLVGRLACISQPLVKLRIHPAQISQGITGQQQQVDARVALTSYWLRKLGAPDPVDGPDHEFGAFYRFVDARIQSDANVRHFARLSAIRTSYRKLKSAFRAVFAGSGGSAFDLNALRRTLATLVEAARIGPSSLLAILEYKMSYWALARIARRSAREWIRYPNQKFEPTI